jgi:glycosyltransferase involved in cell wall biosynthesis
MVTGAYYPEASGAGLQCRALVRACADRVTFSVLTTAVDPSLPAQDTIDGVPVRRVVVSASSRPARFLATPRMLAAAWTLVRRADIVHLHGFSAKSRLVIALARLLRRRVVIKLTSVGHDDAVVMRRNGGGAFRSFASADRFVGVSPQFERLHAQAALPPEQFRLIPNGVDLDRFHPATVDERAEARRTLGLPAGLPIVLFVGFFSHEKRPDVAFDAWTGTFDAAPPSALVFVGRTRSPYYEIDSTLADRIRADAARLRCAERLTMVEQTPTIEQFYRAADVLIFPSTREGLPNVVLEAMASGLPCVVSRLPGVTDSLVTDGVDGMLVEPGDRAGFGDALREVLTDPAKRARLGAAARLTAARYSLASIADRYVELYRGLLVERS